MTKKKQAFIEHVTGQIRSKEAKQYVSNELEHHLQEAKSTLVDRGMTDIDAEEKAIAQMGNPVLLGQQMNKLHRPKVDWFMLILLTVTLGLSFLPMLSLGYMTDTHFVIYKSVMVILGLAVTVGLMLIDYRKLQRFGWVFYAVGLGILLLLTFGPSQYINGSPSMRIGPLSIVSMMALPFFFLAWASFFNDKRLKVWQLCGLFVISIYFFFTAIDLSTAYLYSMMVFVMLWWSNLNRKTIFTISAVAVSGFIGLLLLFFTTAKSYQMERFLALTNPEKFADGSGYLLMRVKEALANAGWFGNSAQSFIPEAHTNLVFVTFTYYYGWAFAVVLVLSLSMFIVRMMLVSRKIEDSYGKLLLVGAITLFAVQLFTNLAMTLGVFPMTSMSLPFISYGLIPTVLNAMLIGVALSVYRRKDLISQFAAERKS